MNSLRRVHEVDFKATDPHVSRKGYQEILRRHIQGDGRDSKNYEGFITGLLNGLECPVDKLVDKTVP